MKRLTQIRKNDVIADAQARHAAEDLMRYIPEEVGRLENPQTAIPRIAKDRILVQMIEAAVTGGAQMDGFVRFVRDLLYDNGLPLGSTHHESRIEIPGWFRSEKKWDLLVILDGRLIAAIEFKS